MTPLAPPLHDPARGLTIVPIRHHSPACARHLRALLRELRPAHVLIEGPADLTGHIDLLLHPGTVPPVALVSLLPSGGEGRQAAYFPLCAHSPEYVALQEGRALGARLAFVDSPSAARATEAAPDAPLPLTAEPEFDGSDYVAALARRTGCRDGYELWDHLFETRAGRDWRSFFADVGAYCAGLRAATPPERIAAQGDAAREAHMARAIHAALPDGPVVAVVGGFHAPALWDAPSDPPPKAGPAPDSYLVRYGFRALDALQGYGAGLPQPGYYQALWEAAPETTEAWRGHAIGLLSDFAERMRDRGHPVPLPAQVEAARMAETLSLLRGRPGALRADLIDGVTAALTKGEAGPWPARFADFLAGDRMGEVPAEAGQPPLVGDVRRRAEALRFDLSDGAERRRRLDIRRKPAHLAAARLCHATALLGLPFATRRSGPDHLTGRRTELLFEEWTYAWTASVETALIEAAALGDDLPAACLAHLMRARRALAAEGKARDLAALATLLYRGLLAGLGARLAPFLAALEADIADHGTFGTTTLVLRRLIFVRHARGPLGAPEALDLSGVLGTAHRRLIHLCADLAHMGGDDVPTALEALRVLAETMRDAREAGLNPEPLRAALDAVADRIADPVLQGAVLAVCVQTGLRPANTLTEAVDGRLRGTALDQTERIGTLRGILTAAPRLLWQAEGLLDATDRFLTGLPEDDFLDLLPHLRLAFTALDPREADRLARDLGCRHGVSGTALRAPLEATGAEVAAGRGAEAAALAQAEADGLADWLEPAS